MLIFVSSFGAKPIADEVARAPNEFFNPPPFPQKENFLVFLFLDAIGLACSVSNKFGGYSKLAIKNRVTSKKLIPPSPRFFPPHSNQKSFLNYTSLGGGRS